jgi:hypothetical protein
MGLYEHLKLTGYVNEDSIRAIIPIMAFKIGESGQMMVKSGYGAGP